MTSIIDRALQNSAGFQVLTGTSDKRSNGLQILIIFKHEKQTLPWPGISRAWPIHYQRYHESLAFAGSKLGANDS